MRIPIITPVNGRGFKHGPTLLLKPYTLRPKPKKKSQRPEPGCALRGLHPGRAPFTSGKLKPQLQAWSYGFEIHSGFRTRCWGLSHPFCLLFGLNRNCTRWAQIVVASAQAVITQWGLFGHMPVPCCGSCETFYTTKTSFSECLNFKA